MSPTVSHNLPINMVCRLDFYIKYHADGLAFNSDITIVDGEGTDVYIRSYSIMLELIIYIPPDSLHTWE